MVDPAPAACVVSVLAPGAGPSATVIRRAQPGDGSRALSLPTLTVTAEPSIVDVVAALGDLFGQPVTLLRATAVTWDDVTFEASGMVVEIDVLDGPLPERLTCQDLQPSALDLVDPPEAHESLVDWLDERIHGWSELRPAWSRPGWLAAASDWMLDRMAAAGYVQPQQPRVHHLWGISAVVATPSASGTAYLKCSGAAFSHEAVLTKALAVRTPAVLPEVLAVDGEHGWLLMRELPGPELGEGPASGWGAGLVALAEVQHRWLGRADELLAVGARPRPLAGLAAWVGGTPGMADLMGRLDPTARASWLRSVPILVEACERLDALGPGPSLVHGDFHPWNVAAGAGSVRIFDWTDGAVSHPFLDLVTYVMRTDDVDARRQMMELYLDCWTDDLPGPDLEEVGRLALVVGALHQAQTYTQLVPTILPADRGMLADGDVQWLRRSLDRLELGLFGAY